MKNIFLYTSLFSLLFASPAMSTGRWGEHKEWMDMIGDNCQPTITGRIRRVWNEKIFWVDVSVSMQMWQESMAAGRYELYCRDVYHDNSERRFRCLASIQSNFDWHNRCRPLVRNLCRRAGGFCN